MRGSLCQYLTLLAPVLPPADLTEQLGGATVTRVELDIFSSTDVSASDITAINNPRRPRHRLVLDWLDLFGDGVEHTRRLIATTPVAEMLDLIPRVDHSLCPKVTVYKANLSTCSALVRSNPSMEEKITDVAGYIDSLPCDPTTSCTD